VLLLVAIDCDVKPDVDLPQCAPATAEELDVTKLCGLSGLSPCPIRAVDVTKVFWSSLPDAKTRASIDWGRMALGRWKLGYRAMCTFHAGLIVNVPEVSECTEAAHLLLLA
jgi:hypothetical protein